MSMPALLAISLLGYALPGREPRCFCAPSSDRHFFVGLPSQTLAACLQSKSDLYGDAQARP